MEASYVKQTKARPVPIVPAISTMFATKDQVHVAYNHEHKRRLRSRGAWGLERPWGKLCRC